MPKAIVRWRRSVARPSTWGIAGVDLDLVFRRSACIGPRRSSKTPMVRPDRQAGVRGGRASDAASIAGHDGDRRAATSSSSAAARRAARSRTACRADPATRVLVLEAGRPDWRFDVFIHMPAALTFPIGSRFYDWKYESEPEPFMHGRRIYHARGKVLGGSSSDQRHDLPARQPARLRALGGRPGHGDLGLRPLPAVLQADGGLPRGRAPTTRGAATAARSVLERGPATSPLFTAFFEAAQEAGYQLTDDVNGYRQEGFAPFDRNIRRGRRLSAARAYLHPVMGRPEPHGPDPDVRHARSTFEGRRAIGRRDRAGRAAAPRRSAAGEVILAGGAINTPQLLQLSGRRAGRATSAALGIPVVADLPGVGEHLQDHLEVYIQHKSLPAGLDAADGDAEVAPAVHRRPVAVPAQRARARRTTSRAAASSARNDDVAYPNLMFHFLPLAIRYDGSAGAERPRLPGPRRADVLRRPRLGEAHVDRPARPSGAPLQLPLDRPGPARVGRGGPRRAADPRPAGVGRRTTAARLSPGPGGRDATRRSSTGSRATPRRRSTRRARRGWASTTRRSSTR